MSAGGTLRAHVETWRPYTMWYPGLVALGGAALIAGPHHPWRLFAAWLAPTAGWLGGHYLGDYFDRELDAIGKPHRPIPSGRLSPNVARSCGCGCFGLLAVLAVAGGVATTGAAVLGALGIVGYSRWLKARGVAGNLIRGALGALALLYGVAAIGQHPTGRLWPALLLLAVGWLLHDTSSNLVGAIRDVEGDRAGGYQTLPVRHGSERAVRVAIGLYAGAFAAALAGGLLADRGNRPVFGLTMLLGGRPGNRGLFAFGQAPIRDGTADRVAGALGAGDRTGHTCRGCAGAGAGCGLADRVGGADRGADLVDPVDDAHPA